VEALGVIERSKISSEMKDLDQASRATLRKYGVRFGAYHIYVPALLKPAGRALAALLWAEKQGNVEMSALTGAQHLASSGRTSFPVDKTLPRDAYRVLGYRQCGERAVRVDILERLADLIRPALAWRDTVPGDKPAGAFDGRGFVVTQAMTSLTGSAGEDFASILRALGYRMEKRAPLPPKEIEKEIEAPVEATAAETAPADAGEAEIAGEAAAVETVAVETAETPATSATETPVDTAVVETAAAETAVEAAPEAVEQHVPVSTAASLPGVDFVVPTAEVVVESSDAPAAVEPVPADAPQAEQAPQAEIAEAPATAEAASEAASAEAPASETAAAETAPAEAADETVAAAVEAEPQLIEVWRPGGRSEERRPRQEHHRGEHHRGRHRHQDRAPGQAAATGEQAAVGSPAAAGEGDQRGQRHRQGQGQGRRDRVKEFGNDFRKGPPREGAPAAAEGQAPAQAQGPREDRGGRRDHDAKGGRDRDRNNKGKFGGDREGRGFGKGGGRDKRDSGPSLRPYASSSAPRERDRPIDPNSPFAKLAALKEQLAANTRKD
jgi:ATP-dependent RNA helicase SUPV3L1/SUV3